jgi:Reverse transcriptase (RNA-dependent DNA polymerase)
MEGGEWTDALEGTPQGAGISPLLANIFLHYVLDLWVHRWRRRTQGCVSVVRYADDFVMGFERDGSIGSPHGHSQGGDWWPDAAFEREYIAPEQDARYQSDAWEDVIAEYLAARPRTTVLAIAKDPECCDRKTQPTEPKPHYHGPRSGSIGSQVAQRDDHPGRARKDQTTDHRRPPLASTSRRPPDFET